MNTQSFSQTGQIIELSCEYLSVRCIWLYVLIKSCTPASSKEFLDIQATTECGFTLKCIHGLIRTYSQMQHTDKYSQRSSIIGPVWQNGWVFVYELSGCGFQSSCSHLNIFNLFSILLWKLKSSSSPCYDFDKMRI